MYFNGKKSISTEIQEINKNFSVISNCEILILIKEKPYMYQ